jgi:hypothetical protein
MAFVPFFSRFIILVFNDGYKFVTLASMIRMLSHQFRHYKVLP